MGFNTKFLEFQLPWLIASSNGQFGLPLLKSGDGIGSLLAFPFATGNPKTCRGGYKVQGCQPSWIIRETPDFGPNLLVSRFRCQISRINAKLEITLIFSCLNV